MPTIAYLSKCVTFWFHQTFMLLFQLRKRLVMKRARESDNDTTLHAKEFAIDVDFVKWQHREKTSNHSAISTDML